MIRQLGNATWFLSLSAAETRWKHLLRVLGKLVDNCVYSDDEISAMSWQKKSELIQKDPVTCARMFDHMVQIFIHKFLKSNHLPLGDVQDFFYRVEFQQRGSPHIHALLWIKDAPVYGKDSSESIVKFVDKYLSCAEDILYQQGKDLVNLQTHRHAKTCKKRNQNVCRFNYPLPPLPVTMILQPLDHASFLPDELKIIERNSCKVQVLLEEMKYGSDVTFTDFLQILDLSHDEYVLAIRYPLKRAKLFLKRRPTEIRINSYNPNLLAAWQANMDVQFVLDPYSCAVYILSYISKGQRGMSKLLEQANKEAQMSFGENIQRQVRHIGNKFLNAVEISAQEAVYLVMQMPLKRSSRAVQFINTAHPSERCFLLKSMEKLHDLPDNSTEIESDNILKKYSRRPRALEDLSLADFVAWYEVQAECKTLHSKVDASCYLPENQPLDNCDDDVTVDSQTQDEERSFTIPGGLVLFKRKRMKVIRSVRYNKEKDSENFYRERLMLYVPWRNEMKDLLAQCHTYQERYMNVKEIVQQNSVPYENNSTHIEEVMEDLLYDELKKCTSVAPNTEHIEEQDYACGSKMSKFYGCFEPTDATQQNYDLIHDMGTCPLAPVNAPVAHHQMSDLEFFEKMRTLNREQIQFFYHVLHSVKTSNEPLRIFLSGGAGVGKSWVLNLLYEALSRHLSKVAGENPDDIKVIKIAPTGKAAFNIRGNTIHSSFLIPVAQGFRYKALDSDRLNTMRKLYGKLQIIFIDEISMVGSGLFNFLNHRLQQIIGNQDPFGGLSIIAVGDLFQLQPVFDRWIFERCTSDYGALAVNIWQECFTFCELSTVMRQKEDKQFAELLNRLREGSQTEADVNHLSKRVVPKGQCIGNYEIPMSTHLFMTNASVNSFNEAIYRNATGDKAVVRAIDIVVGDMKDEVKEKLLTKIPNDPTKTMGLHKDLLLAVGQNYDLTLNVSVADGLTNGAECTVKKIDYRVANSSRPSIVWVQFSENFVGISQRHQYRNLRDTGTHNAWTPIFEVKRQFTSHKNSQIQFLRRQFPLRQASAKTIHRCQGDTLNNVVVNFSGRPKDHMHYVGLSRVRNLNGLLLQEFDAKKICCSQKVKVEMQRLRTTSKFTPCVPFIDSLTASIKICFHNVRSLPLHINDVRCDVNVDAADMNIFVETNLTTAHHSENLQIEHFQLFRNDNISDEGSYGTAFYVRENLQLAKEPCRVNKNHVEITFCILGGPVPNLHVFSVYRSSSKVPFTELTDALHFVNHEIIKANPAVIFGDFNINLLQKNSPQSIKFLLSMKENGFTQLISTVTTDYGSLLDHIYTNVQNIVSNTTVTESYFSDHKPIVLALK